MRKYPSTGNSSSNPGDPIHYEFNVAFTVKQHVQTDLKADRQVATTLAELIIGGSLVSMEIDTSQGAA